MLNTSFLLDWLCFCTSVSEIAPMHLNLFIYFHSFVSHPVFELFPLVSPVWRPLRRWTRPNAMQISHCSLCLTQVKPLALPHYVHFKKIIMWRWRALKVNGKKAQSNWIMCISRSMNNKVLSSLLGCEFFKDYKDRDYTAEGLVFNWNQVLVASMSNLLLASL